MSLENKKITLVVGAGASRELGLPTGAELKAKIASLLDIQFPDGYRQKSGDYQICDALKAEALLSGDSRQDINPHLHAAWRIRDAMPQAISIDNFIDTHQGDKLIELCGKLAITRSILEAERSSILYLNPQDGKENLNFSKTEACWLNPFVRILTENCKESELEKRLSSITLIVFNYDRCIEHYLYLSLQNYYGISKEKAAALVKKIEIYHPYGTVGPLPWQAQSDAVPYGTELNPDRLLAIAKGIKTFTEGTDPDSSEIVQIKHAVGTSSRVLFLGFAFHRLNLQLISPQENMSTEKLAQRFLATAKGISKSDCDEIRLELATLGHCSPMQVELRNDLACRDIFFEYTRGLSLL
ncbi:hypothetical protein SCD_n02375 [Sulfuricella denitrificans skB26]|uniref:SIR2-like domain-containing protein n=1 Tax=Sulfuricella denitrificans (strain DSM 22764 / NBRC 105220 / skB26) TaxID=1163617 RepID=S6AD55_SULDS|nr:hypothetical protein [Sulfuricella denitrificans]BAN36183.1 hypothetical protein SCD_n02375 [Sulfuricella denitrificans skB26]